MLRALVIGGGAMARTHAEIYTKLRDASVVGIVDPDARGRKLAADLQISYSTSLRSVDWSAFDVVHVCAPTPWHRELVEEVSKHHKHILCEKPIARTLADAEAMMAACDAQGVRLMIGHCVRYFPEYQRAKELIDEGRIGEVAVARLFRGGSFPPENTWQDWYANRNWSGGTCVDLMVHDFDFLRWVFGPVARVYAKSTYGESNRLELTIATLRFVSGEMAHVTGSWAHTGFGTRFELAGSLGLLEHDSAKAGTVSHETTVAATSPGADGVQIPCTYTYKSPYQLEIEDFLDAIVHDRPFRVTAEDAREALRIGLAVEQSARSGLPVTVSEPQPFGQAASQSRGQRGDAQ